MQRGWARIKALVPFGLLLRVKHGPNQLRHDRKDGNTDHMMGYNGLSDI